MNRCFIILITFFVCVSCTPRVFAFDSFGQDVDFSELSDSTSGAGQNVIQNLSTSAGTLVGTTTAISVYVEGVVGGSLSLGIEHSGGTSGDICDLNPTYGNNFSGVLRVECTTPYVFLPQLSDYKLTVRSSFVSGFQSFQLRGSAGDEYVVGDCSARCGSLVDIYVVFEGDFSAVPSPFYAQIKNTSSTTPSLSIYSASSTTANVLKNLPGDWVVYVASTTDQTGNPVISGGYRWYQVTDPTDNVSGWMIGSKATGTPEYLPYSLSQQTTLASISDSYVATSSRPNLILEAVDHYFNNASTTYSLYSSDDSTNNISDLKSGKYEKKVIWGIAARESGATQFGFGNEIISYDYGHGIMQITLAPNHNPPFDNRGYAKTVTIPPCSLALNRYLDCYTGSQFGTSTSPKYYKPNVNYYNFTYKQYTDTEQSIYSNIKDGMEILSDKFNIYSYITASTTINGITYSPIERKIISATESYNGACRYVDDVADVLDDIDFYFANATTSDISTLVQKMHIVGTQKLCAQLHSPADLSIQDSQGRIVGVVDGEGRNDFPMAVYDQEQKFVKLSFPGEENYFYKVIGTGDGSYGLDITIIDENEDQDLAFNATEIPIVPREIHIYSVDRDAIERGEEGITIDIDFDGDGISERTIRTGLTLTREMYLAKLAESQIEFSILSPSIPNLLNTNKIIEKTASTTKNRVFPNKTPTTDIRSNKKLVPKKEEFIPNEFGIVIPIQTETSTPAISNDKLLLYNEGVFIDKKFDLY